MTVTRCESMFQSGQRFARFRKLRIDRKRALVPSPGFRFEAGALASAANVECRICIKRKDIPFESIGADCTRCWSTITSEQSFVLSEQSIQRPVQRFRPDDNSENMLGLAIIH